MRRILTVAFLALAPAIAVAQTATNIVPSAPPPSAVTNPAAMPSAGVLPVPPAPALATPAPIVTPTPIAAPGAPVASPTTQNTVNTSGPVTSETTSSVGTLAGQVLQWLAAAFSVPIGGLLTAWLYRLFKLAGVQVADGLRSKLQEIIVNGLNVGAKSASEQLAGTAKIEVKNAIVAQAVEYTQAHGAETIKALGLDPKSGAAVEAIKARIETAIADPAAATPAILDLMPAAPAPKPVAT